MTLPRFGVTQRHWSAADFRDDIKRNQMFVREQDNYSVDVFTYGAARVQSVVVGWPLGYSLARPTAEPFLMTMPDAYRKHLASSALTKDLHNEIRKSGIDLHVIPLGVFPFVHDDQRVFQGKGGFLDYRRYKDYQIAPGEVSLACFLRWLHRSVATLGESFAIPLDESINVPEMDWTTLFAKPLQDDMPPFLPAYCLSPRGQIEKKLSDVTEVERIIAWLEHYLGIVGEKERPVPSPDPRWGLARAVPLNLPKWLIVPQVILPNISVKPIPIATGAVAERLALLCALRARLVRLLAQPWFTASVISPVGIGELDQCMHLAPPLTNLPFDPVAELEAYVAETRALFPSLDPDLWLSMYQVL